jgi:hypothetical protein
MVANVLSCVEQNPGEPPLAASSAAHSFLLPTIPPNVLVRLGRPPRFRGETSGS